MSRHVLPVSHIRGLFNQQWTSVLLLLCSIETSVGCLKGGDVAGNLAKLRRLLKTTVNDSENVPDALLHEAIGILGSEGRQH